MDQLVQLVWAFHRAESLEGRLQLGGRIVTIIRPSLWAYIAGRGLKDATEDVLQVVLKTVFERLGSFHGRSDREVWAWCYGIAYHKIIDHLRREGRHPTFEFDEAKAWQAIEAANPGEPVSLEDRLDFAFAIELFKELDPIGADYILHHYVLGLELTKIAELFGVDCNAVRMRINRCLEKARPQMNK